MKNVLVTGGCGFIGSNFLNYMMEKYPTVNFINIDKIEYCARMKNVHTTRNYTLLPIDICQYIDKILVAYNIDSVIHFAAYSHVDMSFQNSLDFTINNILGTHYLLESCRRYGKINKFIHISTDEVYGDMPVGTATEQTILSPTNPYAATKAAAEMLVLSYQKSFNLPVIITRSNNVYGEQQYTEKLIPKFIKSILEDIPCTIHGDGLNTRNFIYVLDVVKAIELILNKGIINEIYNIGTNNEYSVLEIFTKLQKLLGKGQKIFVKDREFNDTRYSIDITKLEMLGWKEETSFEKGLEKTVEWYKQNINWF